MKNLCLIFCCMLLFACNSSTQKSPEELERESLELYAREKAKEDSIRKVAHDSIETVLSKTDSGKVVGDIVLGMSEKDFNAAYEKFYSEVGQIDVDGSKFKIAPAYQSVFRDGKLIKTALRTCYYSSVSLPKYKGDEAVLNDPGKDIRNRIYNHLRARYGHADSISHEGKPCNLVDFDYARWVFSFKVIEILEDKPDVYAKSNGDLSASHDLYIIYSEPATFMRDEFVADSIKNEQLRQKREQEEKEKAASEQL